MYCLCMQLEMLYVSLGEYLYSKPVVANLPLVIRARRLFKTEWSAVFKMSANRMNKLERYAERKTRPTLCFHVKSTWNNKQLTINQVPNISISLKLSIHHIRMAIWSFIESLIVTIASNGLIQRSMWPF